MKTKLSSTHSSSQREVCLFWARRRGNDPVVRFAKVAKALHEFHDGVAGVPAIANASVPDARAIGDSLAERGVRLQIGASVHDPNDPMGKLFFNILATFAEFEADLIKLRTR